MPKFPFPHLIGKNPPFGIGPFEGALTLAVQIGDEQFDGIGADIDDRAPLGCHGEPRVSQGRRVCRQGKATFAGTFNKQKTPQANPRRDNEGSQP